MILKAYNMGTQSMKYIAEVKNGNDAEEKLRTMDCFMVSDSKEIAVLLVPESGRKYIYTMNCWEEILAYDELPLS